MTTPKAQTTDTDADTDRDPGRSMAEEMGYIHQKALLDFNPRNPGKNVLGGDIADLALEDMEAVRSVGQDGVLLTIYARTGDGQDMAEFLHAREDIINITVTYANDYRAKQGPDKPADFRMYPLSAEQKRSIEEATGHHLPPDYRG